MKGRKRRKDRDHSPHVHAKSEKSLRLSKRKSLRAGSGVVEIKRKGVRGKIVVRRSKAAKPESR